MISTLTEIPGGSSVRVHHIESHPDICNRLLEMGFCENAVVRCVMNNDTSLICEVCNTRIGLSHVVARNIFVAPFE